MKRFTAIISILILIVLAYAARYRTSMSDFYKKGLINIHTLSGSSLTIPSSKNFVETVYLPLNSQVFAVSISGANEMGFFFVYDTLRFKEYKPSGSIQGGPQGYQGTFFVNNTQKIMFDIEVGVKHLLRNTFLDRGGKLIGVAIQLAPISGSNIIVKTINSDNLSRLVSEKQKQFDSLVDLPIVSSYKVNRGDGLLCGDALTGYYSSHDYPSLGIKIYTEDDCGATFELEPPFIIKNGSMLVDPYNPGQYIQVIAKHDRDTIQDIFERDYKNQFESGCNPVDSGAWWLLSGNDSNNMQKFVVSNGGSCKILGNGMHQNYLAFIYNKNKPDRYYLFSHTDGCAPGKCNVFNKIELY